jgi:hypothetical protein
MNKQRTAKELSPHHYLKLLGRVFSERLTKFSDAFLLLNENQCGFQRGYSAVDNLFIIHSLFEILKFKKKKIFCAFIHFEKAFDTLYLDALRYRLLLNNVNGNRFNVINIVNMYEGTKSCIMYKDSKSDYFPCSNGVRQGENLQPFSFCNVY